MGKNDILYELVKIANCTSIQAQKLLEKNNWDLQQALTDFYDNGAPEDVSAPTGGSTAASR